MTPRLIFFGGGESLCRGLVVWSLVAARRQTHPPLRPALTCSTPRDKTKHRGLRQITTQTLKVLKMAREIFLTSNATSPALDAAGIFPQQKHE